ncbi:hypothetical protein BH24ACT22_BH24ACT22_13590 [soil metagenome]
MSYQFDRIPEDLKQDPSWVLWKHEKRDGEWTKVPFQPNRNKAKTNKPSTWTTFERAVEAYERDDFFDGIGFVFHKNNPYAGADFDDMTEDQVREWMDRFDSYVERSPSGNGFHIIIKAELPQGTKRKAGELYSSGRFFTMTGDTVRDAPVREAQDVADMYYGYLRKDDQKPRETSAPARNFDTPDLDDTEVLRLLENARNGHTFAMIYAGAGEFASGSERDLSLANRVAFYTQDEDQVERIMRGSGCAREKWDKHRTYLRDTIRKAISGLTNTYTPAGVTNIKTKRTSKKNELRAGVRELVRRWQDYDWARVKGTEEKPNWMRGHTCRDVMIVLINEAEKHGKVSGDNIEVGIGRRKLALQAATSLRTVHKAVKHLEKEGWLEFQPPSKDGKPGVYVLRASLHHVLSISTEVGESKGEEGGGEDLRAPCLRWPAPTFERIGDHVERGYIKRLGKHNGAIIDRLLVEGGDMHVEDLAEVTNKQTRDLKSRNLSKLREAGIVELDGNTVRLAENWREALQTEREIKDEIAVERRDRDKYRRQGEAFRDRGQDTPTEHYANNPDADGTVGDLEHFYVRDLSPEDAEVLEAIEWFESRYGRGSFKWGRSGAKELFYSAPGDHWPEPDQLQRISEHLEDRRIAA